MSRAGLLALALLTPVLLAVADPEGDLGPCATGFASDGRAAPIDIVEARGEIIERGMALRFTVVFAEPLPVPDVDGRPFRVDVVLHDPDVPTMSFRYYRDLNRIVRFDAVPDPLLQIVLLPERGANIFVGATALGDTLTMTFPGRLITRDRDLEGLSLERILWGVIARDDDVCDVVGRGRPTLRLVEESMTTPEPTPTSDATPSVVASDRSPSDGSPVTDVGGPEPEPAPRWFVWSLLLVPLATVWTVALLARRRARSRD